MGKVCESTKKSNTIEAIGDHFLKRKKTTEKNMKCLHTAPVVSSKCP